MTTRKPDPDHGEYDWYAQTPRQLRRAMERDGWVVIWYANAYQAHKGPLVAHGPDMHSLAYQASAAEYRAAQR